MHFSELNDDNHMIFAIKHYDNPQAVTQEDFFDDMKKFKYIKRLLKKYKKSGVLRTHLLINHFITIYNLFGEAATPLLFYKIEPDLWSVMKTFIVTLGRLPDVPKCFVHEIPIDLDCYRELKSIL
jgi:hypothetical protein